MDTAEVTPNRSREARRLARATAWLLTGAAVHVWLFPLSSRPGMLDGVAARLKSLSGERMVATAGGSGAPTAVASTLGTLMSEPDTPPGGHRPNRVRVVVERVHASVARPAIHGTPVRLAGAVLLAAADGSGQELAGLRDDTRAVDAVEETRPARVDEVSSPPAPEPAAVEPVPVLTAMDTSVRYPAIAAVLREAPHADGLSEERLVSHVLQQYRAAYDRLDVQAAQSIWPTVDARALSAAFRQLAGQRVTFDSCGVRVSGSGAQATARCTGQAEYVPKVGGRRAVVASGEWVFDLAKQDAAWRIVNANAMIK